MKHNWKKLTALAMAVLFGMSALTGCGNGTDTSEKNGTETTEGGVGDTDENLPDEAQDSADKDTSGENPSSADAAMGRYLENEVPLPEGIAYIDDITKLSDGRLRLAGSGEEGTESIWDTADGGATWTQPYSIPSEVEESGDIGHLALSPTGIAFLESGNYEGEERYYWILDETGAATSLSVELSVSDGDPSFYKDISNLDFSESGRLLVYLYSGKVVEIDTATGAVGKNYNEQQTMIYGFGCVGEDLFLLDQSGARFCHLDGSGTEELPDTLKSQLSSYINTETGFTQIMAVNLTKAAGDTLFFAAKDGIFSYLPGGSVTEQLVNGSLCAISDPSFGIVSFEAMEDDSFYLFGIDGTGSASLFHYVYSSDASTVPNSELNLYSLYDNRELRQVISLFQQANPDIYINYVTGKSGDDGVTDSDALRTLNTEIMAGKGPDLIWLDELPIESYMEKGLLADVSDVIADVQAAEGLISPIANAFQRDDGAIYAVPCKFALPLLYGPADVVSQITDLSSLSAAASAAKEEYPDVESIFGPYSPVMFAETLYDACSPAWVKEDGTLDEGAVTEFYSKLYELYQLDSDSHQTYSEEIQFQKQAIEEYRTEGILGQFAGGDLCVLKKQLLSLGALNGIDDYAYSLCADEYLETYETAILNGQSSHVFIPKSILGVNSKSASIDAAKKFLAFFLSKDAQTGGSSKGFPVNRSAFDYEMTTEKTYMESTGLKSDNGDMITLEVTYPSEEKRRQLTEWVESLSTPALTDSVVRDAIMGQMDDCLTGVITPQQAANAAMQKVNLYLAE